MSWSASKATFHTPGTNVSTHSNPLLQFSLEFYVHIDRKNLEKILMNLKAIMLSGKSQFHIVTYSMVI